ncbi:cephalosporin-C deacetylase [Streptomyces sp. V3I8]|uniref:acetylxylan esterase n=1 Tax=Streptomyces sp. V3I8 TaxID=3042279 RepID=UPI00278A4509|nr:acetylxylan esterase [Streptomyces sp. V3I8]MDQ1033977.1 cephalosporin-C deacetylase [Streptomyces sp. V3I8]
MSGPGDFDAFWRGRRATAALVDPCPRVGGVVEERDGFRIHEVSYATPGGRCGALLALPSEGVARRGFVVGHGYGGRHEAGADLPLPLPGSAAILPCAPGLPAFGNRPGVPSDPDGHVLHGIASRDTYLIGDCVAGLWGAASALLELAPSLDGDRLGYLGESFGGGIGALALPWDDRFAAARLTVPTFGNHPLRLTLPCTGSGESVRTHVRRHPEAVEVLAYFDAATAAARLRIPVLTACALSDPAVPPPGQFAVYNSLAGPRRLEVLEAGHIPYPGEAAERRRLGRATEEFFGRWLE